MHALRVIAVFWILILLGAIALFVAMGWFEDPVTLILACVFLPLACVFPAAVAWKYPFVRIRGQDDELCGAASSLVFLCVRSFVF